MFNTENVKNVPPTVFLKRNRNGNTSLDCKLSEQ